VLQVFLDYVDTMTRLPQLLDDVAAENDGTEAVPNAARAQEIETLSKQIPRLISLLPDILYRNRSTDSRHVAALEEMTKDLLKLVESAQPLLLVSTNLCVDNYNDLMELFHIHSPRSNN
jgi:nuclear pore complex protein Nup98-Nup96